MAGIQASDKTYLERLDINQTSKVVGKLLKQFGMHHKQRSEIKQISKIAKELQVIITGNYKLNIVAPEGHVKELDTDARIPLTRIKKEIFTKPYIEYNVLVEVINAEKRKKSSEVKRKTP